MKFIKHRARAIRSYPPMGLKKGKFYEFSTTYIPCKLSLDDGVLPYFEYRKDCLGCIPAEDLPKKSYRDPVYPQNYICVRGGGKEGIYWLDFSYRRK